MNNLPVPTDLESIRYCNCAHCGMELLGDSPTNLQGAKQLLLDPLPPIVDGWVMGRPYCLWCFRYPPKEYPKLGGGSGGGDPSPWQENAVRALEDACEGVE